MAELEWKMAKRWICSMHIEPINGRAFELSESLFEFAESLRDGIILCQIANKLVRCCITNINRVNNIDKHMFFCLMNINNFLKACVEIFCVSEVDLFSAKDLYYVTNFHSVINTLSVLSRTPQAVAIHNLDPFPPEDYKRQSKVYNEDIYGTLPDILESKPQYINTMEETIYDRVDNYEKIYDTILHCRKSVELSDTSTSSVDKRTHIVNEIIDTEDKYVDNLRIMVEEYIKTLRNHMTKEDKETVFMNTENIYSVHLVFNRELTNRKMLTANTEPVKMDVEAFVKNKEQFLVYAHYCSSLKAAQQRAGDLTKNFQGFRDALENMNKKMDRKFPLQEQLTVAFQRILKYPLLLRDLRKNTPEGHEDFHKTLRAHEAMEDVASYINEYSRDVEHVERVNQIADSVKFDMPHPPIISNYGRHVLDGELQVRFDSDKKVKEKRYGFLFELTLLLCKSGRGDTYTVKEIFDLSKFLLADVQTGFRGKFSQGWSLQAHTSDGISETKNCTLFIKSQADKIEWISELTRCIKDASLAEYEGMLQGHKFHLSTFKGISKCQTCEKLLRGQISQGYKCTVPGCGFTIHKECLPNCTKCLPKKSQSFRDPAIKNQSAVQRPLSRAGRRTLPATNTEKNMMAASKIIQSRSFEKRKDDGRPWFAGSMSRDAATDMLKNCIDGSFLIRESPNDPGGMVMTIYFNSNSFHIKIMKMSNCYYLTDTKLFSSIDDMIAYYKSHSMVNSFPQLPTTLTKLVNRPVKRIMRVVFSWTARNERELSFKEGDLVSVIKDEGNWWFGECDGKEGYFPKNYVA